MNVTAAITDGVGLRLLLFSGLTGGAVECSFNLSREGKQAPMCNATVWAATDAGSPWMVDSSDLSVHPSGICAILAAEIRCLPTYPF